MALINAALRLDGAIARFGLVEDDGAAAARPRAPNRTRAGPYAAMAMLSSPGSYGSHGIPR